MNYEQYEEQAGKGNFNYTSVLVPYDPKRLKMKEAKVILKIRVRMSFAQSW